MRCCEESCCYLEDQGDLANKLTMGITNLTMWATDVIGVTELFTKSP